MLNTANELKVRKLGDFNEKRLENFDRLLKVNDNALIFREFLIMDD